MIRHLSVENYALIERLEMDFGPNLNIITGQTGAGKSILLGAVGLLLGQRSEAGAQRDAAANCIVEGVFCLDGLGLEPLFEEYELDFAGETVIRRVISASGRTRAYVNDLPVPLSTLKLLGRRLIDIHSQHQNLLLHDEAFRMGIVDSLAAGQQTAADYREVFARLGHMRRELKQLTEQAQQAARDREYLRFQTAELDAAALKEGEQEQIEQALSELTQAEAINTALQQTVFGLSEDETGILPRLKSFYHQFAALGGSYSRGAEIAARLDSVIVELRDLQGEAEHEASRVESDPEREEKLSARLNMIYTLQQKHGVRTVAELLALQRDYRSRLEAMESGAERIAALERSLGELENRARELAAELSRRRRSVAPQVEQSVGDMLRRLGMEEVRFQVCITDSGQLSPSGADDIRFMFSANSSMPLQPVEKIASGGEISRVMLALKALSSGNAGLGTVIFDEIDTGVSGRVADAMGEIICELSAGMQVINITHLPQVASKGQTHFRVYKKDGRTAIEPLDSRSRVQEIASMLSGNDITEAALSQARYLLGQEAP